MIRLKYYSHLLLYSKYKFILYLLFYILILLIYNIPTNYTYCMESEENNTENKYLGMGLFVGSIVLMLFLQKFSGGSEPSTFIDMTTQLAMQGTLHTTPEFLDYFTLAKDGKLYINNLNIDAHNIYLNANEVIRQIQLDDKYKQILTETVNQLRIFYNKYDMPIQGMNNLEQILPTHLEHLNNLMNAFMFQTVNLLYFTNFINALESVGAIDPTYGLLLNEFITNGGQPDQFYNFLSSRLQQK